MATRPIVLTCGEPAGVGPELARAAHSVVDGELPLAWMGDPNHLPEGTVWHEIDAHNRFEPKPGSLAVIPHGFPAAATPGAPDPRNAQAVIDVIAQAVALVQDGHAAALCTAPIHKKALKDGAGFAFPGHTEYLAHLAGVEHVVMMLACPELRVVPVTIHIAVNDVPQALTSDLLEHTIRITYASLQQDFGVPVPRIAVAGLNPHAGESGAMGREEIEVITPVLERLRADGFSISGPASADTMFHAAARSRYDAAIAMYHDQALIPIKTIDFAGGVNVTLGLPFIRTSPDHGTAFDIAGKGIADPTSTVAALRMAADMARHRGT